MLHWGCGHRCWRIDDDVQDIIWHVNVGILLFASFLPQVQDSENEIEQENVKPISATIMGTLNVQHCIAFATTTKIGQDQTRQDKSTTTDLDETRQDNTLQYNMGESLLFGRPPTCQNTPPAFVHFAPFHFARNYAGHFASFCSPPAVFWAFHFAGNSAVILPLILPNSAVASPSVFL